MSGAIDAPRFSHTWLPDTLSVEAGLLRDHPDALAALRKLGHVIADKPAKQGDAHSIFVEADGTIHGVADQRRTGDAGAD